MSQCRYCDVPIRWIRVQKPRVRWLALDEDGEPHDCMNKRQARHEETRGADPRRVRQQIEFYAMAADARRHDEDTDDGS